MDNVKKAYEFIEKAKLAVRQGKTYSYPSQESIMEHEESKLSFGEKLAKYSEDEKRKAMNVDKFLGEWGK